MADTKITALTAITTVDPAVDVLPIVDVSDTTMAASGTTKKITSNQILGAGGTATLASATITGDLTVDTSVLKVDTSNNRVIIGHTSGSSAFQVTNAGAAGLEIQPTGFSSAPLILSYNRSGSAYTQLTLDGSTIVHALNGSTAMTLNSTGLGVGASPSHRLTVSGTAATNTTGLGLIGTTTGYNRVLINNTSGGGQFGVEGSTGGSICNSSTAYSTIVGSYQNYPLHFITNNNVQATLDASGNLLVACTSSPTGTTSGFYFDSTHYTYFSRSAGETLNLNRYTSTGATAKFRYAGTEVGDISVTGSGTTFNSISDYRLKESVAPLSGGLARVNALKPSIYKWKSDGSNGEGFIAHELAEVVPLAVTGEKDAVNEDGSIKPQGVDLSRVVPILVAAIKELTARVEALEA